MHMNHFPVQLFLAATHTIHPHLHVPVLVESAGLRRAGCCVILSCNGLRTMRTYQGGAPRLPPEALTVADLSGARWLFLSAYCFYGQGFVMRAVALAREVLSLPWLFR